MYWIIINILFSIKIERFFIFKIERSLNLNNEFLNNYRIKW
jgi:hypothetical protein